MPMQATCPECQSRFTLADEAAGKKIRCSKCQTVFDPKANRSADVDEDITTSPRAPARSKTSPAPAPRKDDKGSSRRRDEDRDDDRPSRRHRDDDDDDRSSRRRKDDEDDRPSRKTKKPARTGMPIFWLIAAVLALFLFIGGVIGGLFWMVNRATDPESLASGSDPAPMPPQGGFQPPQGGMGGPQPEVGGTPHDVPKGEFPPPGFPPTEKRTFGRQ